jgi:hypothetical protein
LNISVWLLLMYVIAMQIWLIDILFIAFFELWIVYIEWVEIWLSIRS